MAMQRRKWNDEKKVEIVIETLTGNVSVAAPARKYGIKDSLIYKWRLAVLERLPHVLKVQTPNAECEDRVAELERKVGQLSVENDALKKASSWLTRMSKR